MLNKIICLPGVTPSDLPAQIVLNIFPLFSFTIKRLVQIHEPDKTCNLFRFTKSWELIVG